MLGGWQARIQGGGLGGFSPPPPSPPGVGGLNSKMNEKIHYQIRILHNFLNCQQNRQHLKISLMITDWFLTLKIIYKIIANPYFLKLQVKSIPGPLMSYMSSEFQGPWCPTGQVYSRALYVLQVKSIPGPWKIVIRSGTLEKRVQFYWVEPNDLIAWWTRWFTWDWSTSRSTLSILDTRSAIL